MIIERTDKNNWDLEERRIESVSIVEVIRVEYVQHSNGKKDVYNGHITEFWSKDGELLSRTQH